MEIFKGTMLFAMAAILTYLSYRYHAFPLLASTSSVFFGIKVGFHLGKFHEREISVREKLRGCE